MKKSAPPNYLLMSLVTFLARNFWILRFQGNKGYSSPITPLLSQTVLEMVSPHTFSVASFRRRTRMLKQKRKGNPKLQYFIRTSLMKLAIGILILDYLIPYNHFLPFFSPLGTVAIK